jgi:hypothetical protein
MDMNWIGSACGEWDRTATRAIFDEYFAIYPEMEFTPEVLDYSYNTLIQF